MPDKTMVNPDSTPAHAPIPWLKRLSTKMLILTVISVLVAEVLIFIPSVANFRLRWLEERLNTAAATAVVLVGTGALGGGAAQRDRRCARHAGLWR